MPAEQCSRHVLGGRHAEALAQLEDRSRKLRQELRQAALAAQVRVSEREAKPRNLLQFDTIENKWYVALRHFSRSLRVLAYGLRTVQCRHFSSTALCY